MLSMEVDSEYETYLSASLNHLSKDNCTNTRNITVIERNNKT